MTAYVSYIIPKPCHGYSVRYQSGDIFNELDASGHFLNVPINLDENGAESMNDIKLKITSRFHDDAWQAIPFAFTRQHKNEIKMEWNKLDYWGELLELEDKNNNLNYFLKAGINFLNAGDINKEITLKFKLQKQKQKLVLNDYVLSNRCTLVNRELTYVPNSWFVAYDAKIGGNWPFTHLAYRIDPSIKINVSTDMTKNDSFQYVTIGNKTVPMSKIAFYKKVNTYKDYLSCLNMVLAIQSSVIY